MAEAIAHPETLRQRYAAGARDFSGMQLPEAELQGIELKGTNLSYADLSGADLRQANLSGADLSYTLLRGANLTQADLRGTIAIGTDLREAILTGARWQEAHEADRAPPVVLDATARTALDQVPLSTLREYDHRNE